MHITRYIASYISFDPDGQCDGKPRILGTYATEEEAREVVLEDMRNFIDEETDDEGHCSYVMDDVKLSVHDIDFANGLDYSVNEIEIELTEDEINEIGDSRFANKTDI